MQTVLTRTPKYLGIQALRGIAACMVVFLHAEQFRNPNHTFGESGVDIFFVISGFVMAVSYLGRPLSAKEFLAHRIKRIVPLYWFMTFLALMKLDAMFYIRHKPLVTPAFLATSLFFIPYRNSLGFTNPVVPPGWTLNFEMFFYLLFAASIALKANVAKLLTPVMLGLVVIGFYHPAALLNPIILEFLAGVLFGYAVHYGYKVPSIVAYLSGVLGVCWLFLHGPRVAVYGISGFLIVHAFVTLEGKVRIPKPLIKIGDSSYSLYLSHYIYIYLVYLACIRVHLPGYVAVAVCVIVCIWVSFGVYRFLEKPLTQMASSAIQRLPGFREAPSSVKPHPASNRGRQSLSENKELL